MSGIRLTRNLPVFGCGTLVRGTVIDLTEPYNGGLVGIGYAEYVGRAPAKPAAPPAKVKDEEPPEPTPKKGEGTKEV